MHPRPSTAPTLAETISDPCWRRLPVCRGDYGIGARCIQDKPALRRLGPPAAALQHALEVEAARATPPSDVDTPKPTSSHPPTRPAIGCQTTPTPESSAWLENDADWSLSPAFALL